MLIKCTFLYETFKYFSAYFIFKIPEFWILKGKLKADNFVCTLCSRWLLMLGLNIIALWSNPEITTFKTSP